MGESSHAYRRPPSRPPGSKEAIAGRYREALWLERQLHRVEGGHTIPSVDTLEKWARALEVPLYQLFYEGEKPPKLPHLPKRVTGAEIAFGRSRKEAHYFDNVRRLLSRMNESKRQLLLHIARKMAKR